MKINSGEIDVDKKNLARFGFKCAALQSGKKSAASRYPSKSTFPPLPFRG